MTIVEEISPWPAKAAGFFDPSRLAPEILFSRRAI